MDQPVTSPPPVTKRRSAILRNRRTWLTSAIGVLIVAALLWFLFAPEPIMVELTHVTQGPMQVTIDNQGQVRVHDKYIVAAPVAAELLRVDLHDGDPVRRNDEVVILKPLPMDVRQKQEATARLDAAKALAREAGLRVQRAYTDMLFASNERARVDRLVKENFVSPQAADKARTAEITSRAEWHAAKSREEAAKADARAAEAALSTDDLLNPNTSANVSASPKRQIRLTSPVDGYVLKVHEKSERTVMAGAPLVTIGDPTQYEIVVDVLSTDAVKIKAGDIMLLTEWGGGKILRARVRLVEPVAFTKISALGVEEQRVNVIADPIDPLGPLGDGYRIEARIVIWSAEHVTKVAASSVFRVGSGWHIFAVDGGRAREREIAVGHRNQDEVEILSGLAPGTLVIRYPGNQIKDGARIAASNDSNKP
ncbi:MAG: efflux RND transporter periplasmic adaptor subunit [Burkholderiaceae bacterium]